MSELKKVTCHAEGDRCHGCDHYLGKASACKYAPQPDALEAQAKRIAELEASLADSNEALQVLGLKLAHAEAENARLSGEREQLNEQLRKMGADWLATAINGEAEKLPATRIKNLVEQHGSYRKVGELLGVDHAYLHRIAHGEKDNMSDDMLLKLGLRRGTFYAAIDTHSANTVGGPTPVAAPVHITAVVVPMQESCGKSWVVFLERSDLPEDAKPWDKRRQSMFQFRESPGMEPPAEVRARETAGDLNEFLNGVTAQSKSVMDAAPAWEMMAIAWLRGKAAGQAQNNERWPDHAKCYPRWTLYVDIAQELANELEREHQKREDTRTAGESDS